MTTPDPMTILRAVRDYETRTDDDIDALADAYAAAMDRIDELKGELDEPPAHASSFSRLDLASRLQSAIMAIELTRTAILGQDATARDICPQCEGTGLRPIP